MTWEAIGWYVIGAFGLFIFLSITVMFLTWIERKFLARIQRGLVSIFRRVVKYEEKFN